MHGARATAPFVLVLRRIRINRHTRQILCKHFLALDSLHFIFGQFLLFDSSAGCRKRKNCTHSHRLTVHRECLYVYVSVHAENSHNIRFSCCIRNYVLRIIDRENTIQKKKIREKITRKVMRCVRAEWKGDKEEVGGEREERRKKYRNRKCSCDLRCASDSRWCVSLASPSVHCAHHGIKSIVARTI